MSRIKFVGEGRTGRIEFYPFDAGDDHFTVYRNRFISGEISLDLPATKGLTESQIEKLIETLTEAKLQMKMMREFDRQKTTGA